MRAWLDLSLVDSMFGRLAVSEAPTILLDLGAHGRLEIRLLTCELRIGSWYESIINRAAAACMKKNIVDKIVVIM